MAFFKNRASKCFLIASAVAVAPAITPVTSVQANGAMYDDFQTTASWALDVHWMIEQGYITGYINAPHPVTKKVGNWIHADGALTESQMLSILLRYELGVDTYKQLREINDPISKQKGFASYWHYVKAAELGIVTKGSASDKSYANVQVTRGQLAQALVSMHYGKPVTLQEAVDFMYAHKITAGTSSNVGQTLANFDPDAKLTRAHIAAFLHRYDRASVKGLLNEVPVLTPTPTGPGEITRPVQPPEEK